MIFFNQYVVYCKQDNTYLNSFDDENYWKKNIEQAEVFKLEENFKKPSDVVDSLYLDKENIVLLKKIKDKWLEIKNSQLNFEYYILDYNKFLKVKENVKKNKKYNDFYVYLIYSILKNKSFYKIINIRSKKFYKTFRKILQLKNNPERFEYICAIMNIEKADYYKAIKRLESELKK